jgi:hypothetical protein
MSKTHQVSLIRNGFVLFGERPRTMSALTGGHALRGVRHPWPRPQQSFHALGRRCHSDQWCFGAVGSYSPWCVSALAEGRQRRHVQVAESSSGNSRLDLLEQPAVAVWIAERGKREIAGMIGCGPWHPTGCAVALELGSRRRGVEHLADLRATSAEFVARRLDFGDDEVEALGRARLGRCDVRPTSIAPSASTRTWDGGWTPISRSAMGSESARRAFGRR